MKIKLDSKTVSNIKTTSKIVSNKTSLVVKINKGSSILEFYTRGSYTSSTVSLDIGLQSKDDIVTLVDGSKFYDSLEFFRDSVNLTINNGYIELSKNKRYIKINGQAPILDAPYVNTEIATFSLATIDSIFRHIGMISHDPLVLIKDQKMMVVSSGTREAILLTDISEKILDKIKINETEVPIVIGLLGKYFVPFLKGLVAQCSWLDTGSIKIYASSKGDSIPGITMSVSDGVNKAEMFYRLLDDTMIKKEIGILQTCSKFSPAYTCQINALDLLEATDLAIVAASDDLSDNELVLSNGINNNTLSLVNRSGSFTDEISMPVVNCTFNISVRNINLSNMLKGMGPILIKLRLDKSHPILMLESVTEKCFIACFNSAIKPFEVKELKDDKKDNVVLSTSSESKERAV